MSAEKSSTVHQGPSSAVGLAVREAEEKEKNMIMSSLHYCKETGDFTWKMISKYHIEKTGSIAGTINPLGYRKITVCGKTYSAHRLAWMMTFGYWPEVIDHINGNPTDNRIENLRNTSRLVNAQNHRKRKTKNSGMPVGVRMLRNGMYQARATVNKKCHSLGTYSTKEEAHHAYVRFADKHHNNPAVN